MYYCLTFYAAIYFYFNYLNYVSLHPSHHDTRTIDMDNT